MSLAAKNVLLRNAVLTMIPLLALANRSFGYVDLAPTLAKVVSESTSICVVEVTAFDRVKHTITLKPVRALKGTLPGDAITQTVASSSVGAVPMAIDQWADPGARGVLFTSDKTNLVCMGMSWYQVSLVSNAWKISKDRPDLPLAYCGTTTRLAEGVLRLLAGKDAILTVEAYGGEDVGTSFDLAFNRTSLPGLARLNRVRLTPAMNGTVMGASSAAGYLLGAGPVEEAELPALIEKLGSPDATTRADAASDIGWLRRKGKPAIAPLTKILTDAEPRVRIAAATAILRIVPETPAAVDALGAALKHAEVSVRRDAARAAGLAGSGAAPIVSGLAAMLKEADESTRNSALASLATIGPGAASAASAVTPLLDDPALQCFAADALGRMGPAVQPIPPGMAKMLSSNLVAAQWAAVRGMSQIGGKEAYPAVTYMLNKLNGDFNEVEGYNMCLYLSMIGPIASDALPTLESIRIKNPVLPSATQWAIQSGSYLPWSNGGARFGGPGGVRGGPGGGIDMAEVIYEAYVLNLGERLRPAAILLANTIMKGTAGDVPTWGYQILGCAPADVIKILSPHLMDNQQVNRERAIVALGYMGNAAGPAKGQLTAALDKAADDREKHLIGWALHAIDREE